MKTKYLLFVCAGVILPLLSIAQTAPYRSYFGAESTDWYTLHEFYDVPSFTTLFSVGNQDTVLTNGVNYKKAYLKYYGSDDNLYRFGMREEKETGSLFINKDGDSDFLVSSMNLEEGDKFYFDQGLDFYRYEDVRTDEKGKYTVVDSVYYKDGRKHIRFEAHYVLFVYPAIPLTFIEGVGPNISFSPLIGDGGFPICFVCYENGSESWKKDINELWDSGNGPYYLDECFFQRLGIPKIEAGFPFKLIRREGEIEVQPGVSGFKSGLVNIWSVQGKLLASKKFNANTIVVIRTSGFPVGPYIIRVENEDTAQSWVQKIK